MLLSQRVEVVEARAHTTVSSKLVKHRFFLFFPEASPSPSALPCIATTSMYVSFNSAGIATAGEERFLCFRQNKENRPDKRHGNCIIDSKNPARRHSINQRCELTKRTGNTFLRSLGDDALHTTHTRQKKRFSPKNRSSAGNSGGPFSLSTYIRKNSTPDTRHLQQCSAGLKDTSLRANMSTYEYLREKKHSTASVECTYTHPTKDGEIHRSHGGHPARHGMIYEG